MPLFLAQGLETTIIIAILLKAIGEVIIMSVIIAALMGNKGFNDFVRTFFSKTRITPEVTTAEK
jgi:ABC-type amino acid transport system permease subunit